MKKLFFFIFMLFSLPLVSQVTVTYSGTLKELLSNIEKEYGYKFMYSNDDIDTGKTISINIKNSDIETVLKEISIKSGITFNIRNNQIILKSRKPIKTDDNKDVKKQIIKPVIGTVKPETSKVAIDKDIIKSENPENNNREISEQSDLSNIEDSVRNDTLIHIEASDDTTTHIANEVSALNEKNVPPVIKPDNKVYSKKQTKRNAKRNFTYSLQSNLLYNAALTPNIGTEIKYKEKYSLLLNGLLMNADWKNGERTYRIWSVMPELRYYFRDDRLYTGLMFTTGQINLKLNDTGDQGNFNGGGLTFGYIKYISDRLKIDFGIGFGYVNYKYEKYNYINGINIKKDAGTRNLWIPVKAGITLVWDIN